MNLYSVYDTVHDWSHRTFGSSEERGPTGPLKHIVKEITEELLPANPVKRAVVDTLDEILKSVDKFLTPFVRAEILRHRDQAVCESVEPFNDPCNLEELADVLILLFDATWRAGHTAVALCHAAAEKMEKNKRRTWPQATADEPTLHVKE